jgi:hypothetical protein
VFSEPPGPPAELGTVVGSRPGEVEVASAEFDLRLEHFEHDPDVYKRLGAFWKHWNVVDIQQCGCGCDERKRAGVMAMRREEQHAEAMAERTVTADEHGNITVAGAPLERLPISPEAEALIQAEAKKRGVSLLAVIEVALRYLAIDFDHPRRKSTLPFSLAQEQAARFTADLGIENPFTYDAVDIIRWFTLDESRGFTRANIIERAVKHFIALPQDQRDEQWRTHTSAY